MYKLYKKILTVTTAGLIATTSLVAGSMMTAASAFAWGGGSDANADQLDYDHKPYVPPSSPPPTGTKIPNGSTAPACSFTTWGCNGSYNAVWIYKWGKSAFCGPTDIGYRQMKETFLEDTDTKSPPKKHPGGWKLFNTANNPREGTSTYYWKATYLRNPECIKEPASYMTSQRCVLYSTVTISKTFPNQRTLLQKTQPSGYTKGSKNISACYNSSSKVYADVDIKEYGKYAMQAQSRAVNANIKVYTEVDPRTGRVPASEIVSFSAEYTIKPSAKTASLDCRDNRLQQPARSVVYTSDEVCNPDSSTPRYQCVRGDVALENKLNSGGSTMTKFKGTIQTERDGEPRKLTFNQKVTGKGVKVNSYSTQFFRDSKSTPWLSGNAYNKQIFQLWKNNGSGLLLSQEGGTRSPVQSGNATNVWVSANEASSAGAPTKLSQKITWKGTRSTTSAKITSVDGQTGAFTYQNITINVPTSGSCTQSASLDFVKARGTN